MNIAKTEEKIDTALTILQIKGGNRDNLEENDEEIINAIFREYGFNVAWGDYQTSGPIPELYHMDAENCIIFYEQIYPELRSDIQEEIDDMVEEFHLKGEIHKNLDTILNLYKILPVAIKAIENENGNADTFKAIDKYRNGGLSHALSILREKEHFEAFNYHIASDNKEERIKQYQGNWGLALNFMAEIHPDFREEVKEKLRRRLNEEKSHPNLQDDESKEIQDCAAYHLKHMKATE